MLHNMLLHYVAPEHEDGEDVDEQDDEEPSGANYGQARHDIDINARERRQQVIDRIL